MATLMVQSVTPDNHVLASGSGITIKFVRNSTSYNTVRVRLASSSQAGDIFVVDATPYTQFTDTTCTTDLPYTVLSSLTGFELGKTYSVEITAFDTAPAVLDWTNVTTLAAFNAPVISPMVPEDESVMSGYPFTASWVVNPGGADGIVSKQTIVVKDVTGAAVTVYSKELDPSTRSVTLSVADIALASDRSYAVTVYCWNDVGLVSHEMRSFTTHWLPPLEPTAVVEMDEESLGATITVYAGEDERGWVIRFAGTEAIVRSDLLTISGTDATVNAEYTIAYGNIQFPEVDDGEHPATQALTLVRINEDGSRWVVATGLHSGDVVHDPLPQLGVPYVYEITAIDNNGSTNVGAVTMTVITGCWAFNFGDRAQEFVMLRYNPKTSWSISHGGSAYHFADGGAGGGLPVYYSTTDRDHSGSASWDTVGHETEDRIADLTSRHPVGWMRDPHGHRRVAHMSWGFSNGVPDRGRVAVSLSWNEMRWEEAW